MKINTVPCIAHTVMVYKLWAMYILECLQKSSLLLYFYIAISVDWPTSAMSLASYPGTGVGAWVRGHYEPCCKQSLLLTDMYSYAHNCYHLT